MQTLDIPEVCALLKLSEATVRRMIESGKLPAARIGWQWRIREQDVLAMLEPANLKNQEARDASTVR